MEGRNKILKALDILEEKANLSPDNTINLDYVLEEPVLFDFMPNDEEFSLLHKFHKEKVIELFEGRDPASSELYAIEIKVNIKNLYSYRNTLSPRNSKENSLKSIIFPGIKWEQIRVRFLDGHNIEVSVDNKKVRVSYKELRFENKNGLKPNTLWELFRKFSENNGKIFWDNPLSSARIRKQKQLLSKSLKKCFGINDDPFFSYKKEKGYVMKLVFLAKPDEITVQKDSFNKGKFDDWEEIYSNSTPSL